MPDLGDVLGWRGFGLGWFSVIFLGALMGVIGHFFAWKIEMYSVYDRKIRRVWILIVSYIFLLFLCYLFVAGVQLFEKLSFGWWFLASIVALVAIIFLSIAVLSDKSVGFVAEKIEIENVFIVIITYTIATAISALFLVPLYSFSFLFILLSCFSFLAFMYLANTIMGHFRKERERIVI